MCPGCESEAISVEVETLDAFLNRHSLDELLQVLDKWNAATGFREAYKKSKRKRIEIAIALKRQRSG